MAVRVVVVQEEREVAPVLGAHLLDHAVEARGVLRQVGGDLATLAEREDLAAPAGGLVGVEHLLEARDVPAGGEAPRERRHHVVDHVEAAVARAHVVAHHLGIAAVLHVEFKPAAGQLQVDGRDGQPRALPAALRAAVGAQLAVVHVLVLQPRVAARAEATVGDAVRLQVRGLVDAEGQPGVVHAVGDRGAQRVVRVEHERRIGRAAQGLGDHVLRVVDLAVAVQLVAEEVEQHERARAHRGEHADGVELVALEAARPISNYDELNAWFTPLCDNEEFLAKTSRIARDYTTRHQGATGIIVRTIFQQ